MDNKRDTNANKDKEWDKISKTNPSGDDVSKKDRTRDTEFSRDLFKIPEYDPSKDLEDTEYSE